MIDLLVPIARILRECFIDDGLQFRRHAARTHLRDRFWLVVQNRMTHLDGSLTLERPCARQHFVKQHARGKDVGARVHSIATRLFRRSVGRGAVRNTDFSDFGVMNAGSACRVFVEEFCESEVEHFHLPARRDHNVTGFDVAMNDAARVCGRERFGGLQSDRQRAFEGQRTAVY